MNIELILVDDGSKDNSLAVCMKYAQIDNRIKVIANEHKGVSSARNDGLRASTGELITFVDSDDYVDENIYSEIIPKLMKENYDLVAFGVDEVDENGTVLKEVHWPVTREMHTPGEFYCDYFKANAWIYNRIYKREILENLFFDETMPRCQDVFYTLTMISKLKHIYVTSQKGYNRLMREGSVSNRPIGQSQLNDLKIAVKMYDFLREKGYGWVGTYRIFISVRRTINRIPKGNIKGYKNYISACQNALDDIKKDDWKDYLRKSDNRKKSIRDRALKGSVYIYTKLKHLLRGKKKVSVIPGF